MHPSDQRQSVDTLRPAVTWAPGTIDATERMLGSLAPDGGIAASSAPKRGSEGAPGRNSYAHPKRGNPPRSGQGFSSSYRGVIHHRRSQRYEAHIWSEGKQTYLGGFDSEHEAAIAYDLAAIKFRGSSAVANFPVETYRAELDMLESITREELVQQLRNQGKSGGQAKTSRFRGVMKHAKGKWEARLGQLCGSKYQYLGLFTTEIDAAVAYDRALIGQRGLEAETNFALDNYQDMLGDHSAAELQAAVTQWHEQFGTDASPVPTRTSTHDWMHHFATFRRQRAEAAAANARRRSSSGAPSAVVSTSPPTFKRFLDTPDESAFASTGGMKHLRGADGSVLPVSSHGASAAATEAADGSASGGDTNRTYSDGAALHTVKPDTMSPSEAAVVELFVHAQRPPSGPALSAPAKFEERLTRTASDQTHSHNNFADGSPGCDVLVSALPLQAGPYGASPPASREAPAHASPCRASPVAPVPLFRPSGPQANGTRSADPAQADAEAANRELDVHVAPAPAKPAGPSRQATHSSQPATLAGVPDTAWKERYAQLQQFTSSCGALPESGEVGQWCAQQLEAALHVAAGAPVTMGGMTREKYLALAALPPFTARLAPLERSVFAECLARLQRFVLSHRRMPSRLLAHIAAPEHQSEEKELADWSAVQRRLAIKFAVGLECGQMCRERILALMQVPGWLDAQC